MTVGPASTGRDGAREDGGVSPLYDCSDETKRQRGVGAARRAIRNGKLVVMPTDTVYGVAADAFTADAVAALLAAKGRGRDMPVPVLVGSAEALAGIAVTNPTVDALVEAFWPGGLTLICAEQPSLAWDLGDAGATVAVRMPDHDVALEVLAETGPLAVSSANVTGKPPARSAAEAREQLGDAVAVYLEAGPTSDDTPSTIVDVSGAVPRVLRDGAISLAALQAVIPEIRADGTDDGADGTDGGADEANEADGMDDRADEAEGSDEADGSDDAARPVDPPAESAQDDDPGAPRSPDA